MQTVTVIAQAMDQARRKFTRGEQAMLLDIFNGTALTPGILGQHLIAQVEDSFADMPGEYGKKWGVNQTAMLEKIVSLDPASAIFLELWAVGFWGLGSGMLDPYLDGKLTLETHLECIIASLDTAADRLEKTKGAFKSAAVAEARAAVEAAREKLEEML